MAMETEKLVTYRDMVDHIFLPRQIKAVGANLHYVESSLLKHVADFIESVECANMCTPAIQRLFSNMKALHYVDEINPKEISNQISNLHRGDMFAMYVREQNCGLFIHMAEDAEAILSTFQASLPNEIIYGNNTNGDIQVVYPTRSVKVKHSAILQSEEFAEQLVFLNSTPMRQAMAKSQKGGRDFDEIRDLSHPMYVSQWLIAAVSNRSSEVHAAYPVISKKIRDEIIKGDEDLPFRRSGLYMAVKVFLQMGLTIEMGEERGKFLYKLVMLSFMLPLLEKVIEDDIVMHMLGKVARRMDKIANCAAFGNHLGDELISVMNGVLMKGRETIREIRRKLNTKFEAIQANECKISGLMKLPRLPLEKDVIHQIPRLSEYTASRKKANLTTTVGNASKSSEIPRHHWGNNALPPLESINKKNEKSSGCSDLDKLIFLADIEYWVLNVLDKNYPELDAKYLRQLANKYMPEAQQFYKNDCFGYSRMVLVMLKIIQVLDAMTVQKYGTFRKHSSGINPKIIEELLLSSRNHLEIAMKLQIYFENRNSAAEYPGLLEENKISASSFSARFAANDSGMQKVRKEILEKIIRNIKDKEMEWLSARVKFVLLESQSSSLNHEFVMSKKGKRHHVQSDKCPKCEVESKIKQCKVGLYERPLRQEAHNQNAVVFELLIPPIIECLREVLYLFVAAHYASPLKTNVLRGIWKNQCGLSTKTHKISKKKLKQISKENKVFLGSTTDLVQNAGYGKPKQPHRPFTEFVVENGYNCTFFGRNRSTLPTDSKKQSVKKFVTLSVEDSSVYSGLQWAVSSTNHSQNGVLAKQCECPAKLSINEFVSFGSLRADGHLLQMRNLYRVLESEALSFETQSVLALVLQSLWEAGPLHASQQPTKWYRESHEDFADIAFAAEMIDLLGRFVQQQESNWKHPLKLVVAAAIAVKLFEINSDERIADRIVQLLLQMREISIEWIALITKTMEKCAKEEERSILYDHLVEVAIGGIFTYFVSRQHRFFENIFADGPTHSSIFAWLHFMVTIKENHLTESIRNNGIKPILIRMAYNIGLNAEAQLHSLITENQSKVHEFIRFKRPTQQEQTFDPIQWSNNAARIIIKMHARSKDRGKSTAINIQLHIVTGQFLMNNFSASGLPLSITGNETFARVFRETIFKVQPMIHTSSRSQYVTVLKYNGFNYSFREENGELFITEQHQNGAERELIPPKILKGDIPHSLIENHSHWWDKDRRIIEFRPKTFESEYFSDERGIEYELNLNTCQLTHVKGQQLLLDVRSDSYKQIIGFFSRLEQKKFIHVLLNASGSCARNALVNVEAIAKVHLVRMNMIFIIDFTQKTNADVIDVESNEYRGMRVSLNQTFGTLIGLRNGLLLEAIPSANKSGSKLFIVPHGEVNLAQGVRIDTEIEPLRQPAFFVYQIDNQCRQIKANDYPGWFYLAYLHAVTSKALPDPFLGMTGTERALQILQSARVWSSSPYDAESIATLQLISELTPLRTFYPPREDKKVMQKIQWPPHLSPAAAQDTYLPIVQKLIADSQRLLPLHIQNGTKRVEIHLATHWPLNERDIVRNTQFNPNCEISGKFISLKHKVTHFKPTEDDRNVSAVRQLSALYDENDYIIPLNVESSIWELLLKTKQQRLTGIDPVKSVISFCTSNPFPDLWIRLYNCARLIGGESGMTREQFHLILSFLAYEGNDMNHLNILQAIAANNCEFEPIRPPQVELYYDLSKQHFELDAIEKIIEIARISWLPRSRSRTVLTTDLASDLEYETLKQLLLQHAAKLWQCDDMNNVSEPILSTNSLDVESTLQQINYEIQSLKNNRELQKFIQKVTQQLQQLESLIPSGFFPKRWLPFKAHKKSFRKYSINFEEKLSRNFNCPSAETAESMERARQIFLDKNVEHERTLVDWWKIFISTSVPLSERYLVHAGLYPRLIPTLVFPKLLEPICDSRKHVIGAIAVMMTREQRLQRIERLKNQPQMELILRREHENRPHEDWMQHKRPEWLLFEIEMDLSIRSIQVKIAERMISPEGNKHSVMQLNMGEGKTAVIVPLLAAVLADGNQLCTLTVLKSLFQTNLRSLRQCLGGMLNRRIYIFPCRRDMQIEAIAGDILAIYEECRRERGVVMTLPEYRLSFQLKIYEAARKGDTTRASHFLSIHNWLNENSRHILDESDAILEPKYQLTYTVGAQLPPDAGALRYKIVQAVLKRVPFHMREMYQMYGDTEIEFNEHYKVDGHSADGAEVFQPCRVLSESAYEKLVDRLIDDFLNNGLHILFPDVTGIPDDLIREVLRNPTVSQEKHHNLMRKLKQTKFAHARETILILCGLLKYEVLQLALSKRYRVNYGVNRNGRRKMAVPFRAKDVAAEMTEFGQPDVAICFTYLSYYYSGLTDDQLYDVFELLAQQRNPKQTYDGWSHRLIAYSGVNLSDTNQRKKLFGVLRFNMHVIDFWLTHLVFPREAKVFEGKLMCSAWDLCSEHLEHVVTGFSGTNDTQLVLPMPIEQNDLEELKSTNENVLKKLSADANQYRHFPANVSGAEILQELVDADIPVLIDAGALMLEFDNEQVAREWLKSSEERYVAAIYFSKDDILMTIDRKHSIVEFESSVYRERLGDCLVYLDDVHTRGTDLRFPSGVQACVTLSGRITRDKTVQACMRMRMLGEGHTVTFWASHEAHLGICALKKLDGNGELISRVIKYICKNSKEFEKEGLVHWSAAGINYVQKLSAHKHFENSVDLNELCKRCTDSECTPLNEMYGVKKAQPLTTVTEKHFKRIALLYKGNQSIFNWINGMGDQVVYKLKEHISNVVRYTQLDQEHERELEKELEEERKISRPPSMPAVVPRFNILLRELFSQGKTHDSFSTLIRTKGLLKLPTALANTKLFSLVELSPPELSGWSDRIFVTNDFSSVVKLAANDKADEFIRPVWWIAHLMGPSQSDDSIFILLSPFECNALMPTFRASKKSVLHMFCSKTSMTQSNLLNNPSLQLPANVLTTNIEGAIAARIAMFAGSMYFNDQSEENAYCEFIGLISRQRNSGNKGISEKDGIASVANDSARRQLTLLALGIIERRFGSVSEKSHVASLLTELKRVRWNI